MYTYRPALYNHVCASCIRRAAIRGTAAIRPSLTRSLASTPSLSSAARLRIVVSKPHPSRANVSRYAYSTTASERPLRLAIIGSGPAGFYTAHRLMKKVRNVAVDMYEQLPVPYGLVRFGVAPDHPEVKNCEDTFDNVASSDRFNYIGNVKIGRDLHLVQMKPHYDAILFSYGASEDRKLGIPGEELPGVYSAREFVAWYNGLPEFRDFNPDLQSGDQAIIIGQGNVALDVARILLTPIDDLRKTDISTHALETLSASKVRSVNVVGRRGPLQVAFTIKEARELMRIPDVAFAPLDKSMFPSDLKNLERPTRRIAELLMKGTQHTPNHSPKWWELHFLMSPISMHAHEKRNHVAGVTFARQTFARDVDPYSKSARTVPTTETITMPASLAFRSVGYKSTALPGLSDIGVPFDDRLGIIPNDPHGRVITPSSGPGELGAGHVHGLYCAGWVKRGPTGVIASTMADAFMSADVIAADWESGVPFLNSGKDGDKSTGMGWDGIKDAVARSGARPVSWEDWKRIDAAERWNGKQMGKEREKFTSIEDMLKVLDN